MWAPTCLFSSELILIIKILCLYLAETCFVWSRMNMFHLENYHTTGSALWGSVWLKLPRGSFDLTQTKGVKHGGREWRGGKKKSKEFVKQD